MSNIIEFPISRVRTQSLREVELRALLLDKGADSELIDYAASRLKYYEEQKTERSTIQLNLPDSLDSAEIESLRLQIQSALNAIDEKYLGAISLLKAKLILAESKIFQYQREKK